MNLKIPIKHGLLTDAPYSDSNKDLFDFDSSDYEDLIKDVINGKPTTYLISGYRGAGKSSFIKKIQEEIAEKEKKSLFIYLNFSKHETKTVVLRKLIRNLYLSFSQSELAEILKDSHKSSIDRLKDLYERTFYAVSINSNRKVSDKEVITVSWEANLKDLLIAVMGVLTSVAILISPGVQMYSKYLMILVPPLAAIGIIKYLRQEIQEKSSSNEVSRSVIYDDEIAEYYLIEILQSLNQAVKPIFIIDEVDKIEDEQTVKNLIVELKPVMLSGLATFMLVAGQNMYFRYHKSRTNDDDIFASLFSQSKHIPLHTSSELRSLFYKIVDTSNHNLTQSEAELLHLYIDYCILKANRIPRRFIGLLRENVKWEGNSTFILINKDKDELIPYSKVLSRIEKVADTNIEPYNYPDPIKDHFVMQLMLKANKLLSSSLIDLSFNEINFSDEQQQAPLLYKGFESLLSAHLEWLLDGLVEDNIIEQTSGKSIREGRFKLVHSLVPVLDLTNGDNLILNAFLRFRQLSETIFNELKLGGTSDRLRNINFRIIQVLQSKNAVKFPQFEETSNIVSVFDEGEQYLSAADVRKDVINDFKKIGFNFNKNIDELLTFYVAAKITEFLPKFKTADISNLWTGSVNPDLTLQHGVKRKMYLAVEIKRRNTLDAKAFKELIYECAEYVNQLTGKAGGLEGKSLLVVFVDDGPNTFKTLRHRFDRSLFETFPELKYSIFFVPVSISNIHLINSELAAVDDVLNSEEKVDFLLSNENYLLSQLKFDHDYLDKVFDLTDRDYKILIRLDIQMLYWRFGIELSKDKQFPPDSDRVGYPVFHLDKSHSSDEIVSAYYDKEGKLENRPTNIRVNGLDEITMTIERRGYNLYIQLFKDNQRFYEHTLSDINEYQYFKVVAWSDKNNEFRFSGHVRSIMKAKDDSGNAATYTHTSQTVYVP